MIIKWKPLLLCLAIPLGIGAIAAFLTRDSMAAFAALRQPPLSPPGWLFPIVWTILYLLMGGASYLILTSRASYPARRAALTVYGLQLAVNFFWPILFFNLEQYLFAFIWLILLWLLILITYILFRRISRLAALLLLPYLAWVTFAGYLNLAIALLN